MGKQGENKLVVEYGVLLVVFYKPFFPQGICPKAYHSVRHLLHGVLPSRGDVATRLAEIFGSDYITAVLGIIFGKFQIPHIDYNFPCGIIGEIGIDSFVFEKVVNALARRIRQGGREFAFKERRH